MSQPTDDQRILAEIERGLSHDDPALAARVDALHQQFPDRPAGLGEVRATRRSPRVVAAVVLTVIAVLGLILTAVLSAPATPPEVNDGTPRGVSIGVTSDRAR
ncbi:DUF3040 domain-containing protein [Streptomyces sp. Je 1-79]|uniref:DUF3040 domain-containing protein n=1 Tax=Streptomyces sp. Je 1-79 TaxID=2943847 RepID=UPI0021A374B3|nr:DUF3040 domain-containing protein [Streptomyces sp. Je 1-79]MCT4353356.1 DUF3040 domain-containing protein [Streptomyces sp. Je 1-79]